MFEMCRNEGPMSIVTDFTVSVEDIHETHKHVPMNANTIFGQAIYDDVYITKSS
jgi:hypothetical protein